ncbi:FHA domain-containing protein [bacterium]|nr:FHA domain-containing protein [bacterium]
MEQSVSEGLLYFLKFPLLLLIYTFVGTALWIVYKGLSDKSLGGRGSRSNSGHKTTTISDISNSGYASTVDDLNVTITGANGSSIDQAAVGTNKLSEMPTVTGMAIVSADDFYLEVLDSPSLTVRSINVDKEIVLGRSKDCDVRLSDKFVSSRHAKLAPVSDGLLLKDLGSSNGTCYNQKFIDKPVVVKEGEEFVIGDNRFACRRGKV